MRNSQSPSIDAIYQNALPYYLDRVDACLLEESGETFAQEWVEKLLKGRLEIQVNAGSQASENLRHLYFESKNLESTLCPKTFGFGYPFFVDTHESELMIAPIFIWHLTIEPSQNRVNSWIIRHDDSHPVLPNYKLIRHLQKNYDVEILEHFENLAMLKKINKGTLTKTLEQLAERTGVQNNTLSTGIGVCPRIDEIGTLAKTGNINWSGVFSLFPPQSVHATESESKPEEAFSPALKPMEEGLGMFHYLPADPYQASVMETAYREKITVVEGESTSGKTQAIANLLINGLLNGQKCLVVSERVPSLVKAQGMLAGTGINQFNFLLKDAQSDKAIILEMLRVSATGATRLIHHNESDFQVKWNQYLRTKQQLDGHYQTVQGKIFGDYNWTETVGLFLASNRQEGKELLNSQLNTYEFEFNFEEFEKLKEGIAQVQPIFKKINTLKHPLSDLNSSIFTDKNKPEGLTFIKSQLQAFEEKTSRLHYRFINKTDRYAARLRAHYERQFEKLNAQMFILEEKIATNIDLYGDDFKKSTGSSFNFLNLSGKKKKLNQAKEEVAVTYQKLQRSFEEKQLFEFEFLPAYDGKHIPNVRHNLHQYGVALKDWRSRINANSQEEIMRLNSKTVHPNLASGEQIEELEKDLDSLLEEFNGAGLYQKAFKNKTLTIPQRQKYLENIIEQLENTQHNLRDYDLFHQWQSAWMRLTPLNQKIVRALAKVKPMNWLAAFESWYLNNILSNAEVDNLPLSAAGIDSFAKNYHNVKPLIINKIRTIWQAKQNDALKELKRKNKKVYNLVFDKNNIEKTKDKHLAHLMANSADAISSIFPIVFTTPHNATHVLPQIKDYYDLVIYDEANRFSVETANAFSMMGKRQIIVGSNDTFGNETSLLQYAKENNVPAVQLKNRYPKQENTDQVHLKDPFQKFDVENLEGRFDEKNGTNDVEAQHIIRLLNTIERTPQRVFPAVGIICFTIEQRDLISSYLLKIKQQNANGADKIRQLERNGMGVFHIDELYGQHFDVLMVSMSIGGVNIRGQLTRKVIFFNSPEGISHIKLLLHKAPETTYLIHSITEDYLQRFLKKPANEGTYLLANLLQLATYSEAGNEEGQAAVLKVINEGKERAVGTPIFAGEVKNALRPYLDTERMGENVPLGKISLPLTVRPNYENGTPLLIHPDGFFSNAAYSSYYWEYQQRELAKKFDFSYIPVWSVKWWKNNEQEARQLASLIIKRDKRIAVNANSPEEDEESGKIEEIRKK
jgi:hypothetical protein